MFQLHGRADIGRHVSKESLFDGMLLTSLSEAIYKSTYFTGVEESYKFVPCLKSLPGRFIALISVKDGERTC